MRLFSGRQAAFDPHVLAAVARDAERGQHLRPIDLRRLAIAEIARRHGVSIIEDEAQGLIAEDPPPPFSALAPELSWTVTGLSKCAFVGLRLAYVVAPDARVLAETMAPVAAMALWQASGLSAETMTRLVEQDLATRLLEAIRREAAERRAVARSILPPAVACAGSGLHLWLTHPEKTGDALRDAARGLGVLVRAASEFRLGGADNGIRISLSDAGLDQIQDALTRLVSTPCWGAGR